MIGYIDRYLGRSTICINFIRNSRLNLLILSNNHFCHSMPSDSNQSYSVGAVIVSSLRSEGGQHVSPVLAGSHARRVV